MNLVFRVDSSDIIGIGHLIRCINLAYIYKEFNIYFICKKHKHNLNQKVIENNFELIEIDLPNKPNINMNINSWLGEEYTIDAIKTMEKIKELNIQIDWLIIDHYAINEDWEKLLKPFIKKILVIDDYTTRKHMCDKLLNQNIDEKEGKDLYKKSVNSNCEILCGKEYLLLNHKYFEMNIKKKNIDDKIERVNIFMGGADTFNITEKIISVCLEYNNTLLNKIKFDVIIGKSNSHYDRIKTIIENLPYFEIHYDLPFIGHLLLEADIAIGAPGSSSYERCLTLTPTLCICIADNQKSVISPLVKSNVIIYLGTIEENYLEKLKQTIHYLNTNIQQVKDMQQNCGNFINLRNNNVNKILL